MMESGNPQGLGTRAWAGKKGVAATFRLLGRGIRALRLDRVARWYAGSRAARQWTVNLGGAVLLIWAADVMSGWIQPTLTPETLFPSTLIGPEAVRVTEATADPVVRVATYTGDVKPWEQNVIYARGDGYVQSLHVYPGDRVRRGDVVVTLETSNLEPRVREALADSALWAAEYVRDSLLFQDDAISASDLDRTRARFLTAVAKADLLNTQIEYATIRALTDGWIADRRVYSGQYVRAGEPVVRVDRLDQIRIQFEVAEQHLSSIRPGTEVLVYFPQLPPQRVAAAWPERTPVVQEEGTDGAGSASTSAAAVNPRAGPTLQGTFRGAPGIRAEVAVVFPAEDPATRTGIVEVRLPNPDLAVRTNAYAVGDFVVGRGEGGVRVPVSALTPMPGGRTVVFVLPPFTNQGAAEEREVRVGLRNGQHAQILSGLEPGERVVYRGNRGLVDGQAVIVLASGEER